MNGDVCPGSSRPLIRTLAQCVTATSQTLPTWIWHKATQTETKAAAPHLPNRRAVFARGFEFWVD